MKGVAWRRPGSWGASLKSGLPPQPVQRRPAHVTPFRLDNLTERPKLVTNGPLTSVDGSTPKTRSACVGESYLAFAPWSDSVKANTPDRFFCEALVTQAARPTLHVSTPTQSDLPPADTPDPEAVHAWNALCVFNRHQIRTSRPRARLTPTLKTMLRGRSREYEGDIDPLLYAVDVLTKPNGFHMDRGHVELRRCMESWDAVEHWANQHPDYQRGTTHPFAGQFAAVERRPE